MSELLLLPNLSVWRSRSAFKSVFFSLMEVIRSGLHGGLENALASFANQKLLFINQIAN